MTGTETEAGGAADGNASVADSTDLLGPLEGAREFRGARGGSLLLDPEEESVACAHGELGRDTRGGAPRQRHLSPELVAAAPRNARNDCCEPRGGFGGNNTMDSAAPPVEPAPSVAPTDRWPPRSSCEGRTTTKSMSTRLECSCGRRYRGGSSRIPVYTVEHNWNGYLEDRRPASNADPYKILAHIVGTLTK